MNGHPSNWLNPRRRAIAQRLADYIWINFYDHKMLLTPEAYAELLDREEMDHYAVDGGADDLFRLGCADVRQAGGMDIVQVRSTDLDGWSQAATPPPVGDAPKNHVVVVRKGGRK
jgi:hypothetical protein